MNKVCPTCNGSGAVDVFIDYLGEPVPVTCPDCGGSGESDD